MMNKDSESNLYHTCFLLFLSARKVDVFDHFGSAFSNMKFRLFGPFFTMPLRTNYNFNVFDYTDRPLTDGRMATLLNTLRSFNAERNNKKHVW
jgi:hypothetical protein